ncbi:helix-turn-helix domain-containing protein [Pelagibius sp.]|uniref:helix-turn-helix domain-containing protein n=1 Tax=Pelagibius sp. TaxID=1931238 RepID=UPI003B512D6E
MKPVSAGQCRAARGLVGMSQVELAEAAGVGRSTVADFERGAREPQPESLAALRKALEAAGIEFLEETRTRGVGVCLRR